MARKGAVLLIGNGPSVLDRELGSIIDSGDWSVGRFNRFQLEPVECTGTRVDWWIIAEARLRVFDLQQNPQARLLPLRTRRGRGNYARKSTGIAAMQHFLHRGNSVVLHGFDHFDPSRPMHYYDTTERMRPEHKHDKVRVDKSIARGYEVSYLKDIV